MECLDCKKIKFSKKENELLACKYDNKTYANVKIIRCFPLSNPTMYLSVRYDNNGEDTEIGVIKDIYELSNEDNELVSLDLSLRYFIPEIIKINKRSFKRQFYTFNCQTNVGEKEIRVKDIIYNLFVTPNDDLLIKDCDENYYLIKGFKQSKDKHIKFIRSFL